MKYGEFFSRQVIEKLSYHVFVRDGVDKSIFEFIENTRPIYDYVALQLKKFANVYCNPCEEDQERFEYKSAADKERFTSSVRKLMDSDIGQEVVFLDLTREDLLAGAFYRPSDPSLWISAADMNLIFKYIDAQKKESCE